MSEPFQYLSVEKVEDVHTNGDAMNKLAILSTLFFTTSPLIRAPAPSPLRFLSMLSLMHTMEPSITGALMDVLLEQVFNELKGASVTRYAL